MAAVQEPKAQNQCGNMKASQMKQSKIYPQVERSITHPKCGSNHIKIKCTVA